MNPRLLAISGSLAGNLFPLGDAQLSIGRDGGNDLCLGDRLVSRRHCIVRRTEGHYELSDLDSHNGTFVQGIPIRARALDHGDVIRVGNSEFVFLLHDEVPGPEAEVRLTETFTLAGGTPVRLEATPPAQRGEEFAEMAQTLAALIRICEISNSIGELDVLERELLKIIFEAVPAERGAIVLLDDASGEAGSVCTHSREGGAPHMAAIPRGMMQRALWERAAILANGGEDARENAICVPLLSLQRAVGVVFLTSAGRSSEFGESHVLLLGTIARIVAVMLENRLALNALRSENEQLRQEIHASTLVGESRGIVQVRTFIARVSRSDSTVLIRGESGTGKELVARAIHHESPRAERPFVAINCAAIPEALLESELFGHERGAFTGAAGMKKGKLEAAEDGTVFLDEIGELAPLLQAKLLRVLQQREFERVGSTRTLPFAARVVAATNKNLEQAIRAGEFRQDLYYRLNVVSVTVPPLREHADDIPLLALFFARKHAARSKRAFRGISREARRLLTAYSWPGNVRELENAIEHALVLGVTEEILPEDLPDSILEEQASGGGGARYHAALNRTKKELVLAALEKAGGSYPEAAHSLGIHPKYLHRLARSLRIKQGAPGEPGKNSSFRDSS